MFLIFPGKIIAKNNLMTRIMYYVSNDMICLTRVVSTGYFISLCWFTWNLLKTLADLAQFLRTCDSSEKKKESLFQKPLLFEDSTDWRVERSQNRAGFHRLSAGEKMANTAFKLNLLIGDLRGLMKISKRKYQSFHHELNSFEHAYLKWQVLAWKRSRFFWFDRPIGWSRDRLNSWFRGKEKFILLNIAYYLFDQVNFDRHVNDILQKFHFVIGYWKLYRF